MTGTLAIDPGHKAGVVLALYPARGMALIGTPYTGRMVRGDRPIEIARTVEWAVTAGATACVIEWPRPRKEDAAPTEKGRRGATPTTLIGMGASAGRWEQAAGSLGLRVTRVYPEVWQRATGGRENEMRFILARSLGIETESVDVASAACIAAWAEKEVGR